MTLKPFPVVILCGGGGTRLYPVTNEIPKSLFEVAGKPFIDHQLSLLHRKGIREVYLLVGVFGDMIEEHVGTSYKDMKITIIHDPVSAVHGTGVALINAFRRLPKEFILMYGDSYLDFEWPDVTMRDPLVRPILMTVYRNEGKHHASNVEMDGKRIVRYGSGRNPGDAKNMKHVDCGLTYVDKSVLCYRITPDFADTLSELVEEGIVWAFETDQRPYEIGNFMAAKDAENYILHRSIS
jgi:NDP-sugar pyrophosphorylase family protein